MSEVSRGGRTILFVSHNMPVVEKLCERAIVLHEGCISYEGETSEAIQHYLHSTLTSNTADGHIFDLTNAPNRRAKSEDLLQRVELYTNDDVPVLEGIRIGTRLKAKVFFNLPKPVRSFDIGLGFDDMFGQRIFTANSQFEPERPSGERVGPQVFVCEIPSFTLMPGMYHIKVWMDVNHVVADTIFQAARITVLEADFYGSGKAPWNGAFVLKHRWYVELGA